MLFDALVSLISTSILIEIELSDMALIFILTKIFQCLWMCGFLGIGECFNDFYDDGVGEGAVIAWKARILSTMRRLDVRNMAYVPLFFVSMI
ncbi:hypothetical protein [Burkholderia oklahomensis]|uniref:hypothetical protein n=1 Tax=Burkholderia oklahomensis TaxID=342113 RepID=UPI0012F49468|nr:hypothetical protein [Burkholderia oklahomensis]